MCLFVMDSESELSKYLVLSMKSNSMERSIGSFDNFQRQDFQR